MNNATQTTSQVASAIQAVAAIAEAIRAVGSIPSGYLYAHVLGTLSIHDYEGAIGILKRAGLVSVSGSVLTWIGPQVRDGGGQ
jgi:hypothetical protein